MKKVYTLVIAMTTLALTTSAQQLNQDAAQLAKQISTDASQQNSAIRPSDNLQSGQRAEGDTLWIDGFEDESLWEAIAPEPGLDSSINGWSIGTTNNSWAPALDEDMDTEGNYARFVNGDPTSTPTTFVEASPFIFEYTETLPDLTGVPAPHLEFEQYGARFITHQAVQMSTDGGETWVTAYSNDNIDPLTADGGSAYPNTQTIRTNITGIVAQNPSNIMIRLFWDGLQNGPAFNYIEYGWFVDNVRIVEGVANDMTLVESTYSQFDPAVAEDYTDLGYSIYHITQVRPVNLQAIAANDGASQQTNVMLSVEVTTPSGTETLTSDPQDVAPGDTATFDIAYSPAAELGDYTFDFEIMQDEEDAVPDDNLGSTTFSVDDNYFALDDRAHTGSFSNYVDDLRAGANYTLTADGTIYGIGVALDEASVEGTFFNAQLLNIDLDFLSETVTVPVEAEMLNGSGDENFAQLALEAPYFGIEGETLFPAFVHFGGADEVTISLSGNCPDNTCFVWATVGDQECDPCFFNSAPMVRLLFAEDVSLNDIEPQNGVSLGQNVPNPAKDYTIVVFNFEETTNDVLFEIRDMSGRLIQSQQMGTLPAGEHTEVIDTQSMNAGIYLYTLYANGEKQTKRMSVVK